MKKIMLLGALAMMLGFVGCSKDDDGFSPEDIVGEWYLANEKGFYTTEDGKRENYDDSYTKENTASLMTFFSDGTFEMTMLDENYPDYEYTSTGEWNIQGNELRLTESWVVDPSYTIKTLNSSTLVLTRTGNDEDGPFEDTGTFKRK